MNQLLKTGQCSLSCGNPCYKIKIKHHSMIKMIVTDDIYSVYSVHEYPDQLSNCNGGVIY